MFNTASDRFIDRLITAVCFLSVGAIAALLVLKSAAFPDIFVVRFNIFGLLSASAALVTLLLLARLIFMRNQSDETKWFIFAVMAAFVFTAAEAMERLSATPDGSVFWSALSGLGAAFVPVGFFLFALSYTRSSNARLDVVTPLVTLAGGIVSFFYGEGDLIFSHQPSAIFTTPWGFSNNSGDGFVVALVWIFALYILAVVLLVRFWHRNTNQLLRRQARLYSLALIIPLIAAFFTDGLTSLLNNNPVPPMAGVLSVVMTVLVFYGLRRYHFFQVNPAILAQNILTTMNEAVIVTRDDYTIEYLNQEAEELLGAKLGRLTSPYLSKLFAPTSWPKVEHRLARNNVDISQVNDLYIINRREQQVPVRVFVSQLVEANEFRAYVFVISDITDITESYNKLEADADQIRRLLDEAHTLERQLQEEKAGVEHTVQVRTRELRVAQEHLKAADAMKTEFMILSSHNLRTPITIMAGSLELLKESRTAKERQTFFDSLDSSIKRIKNFVEDMVTITTLETGSGLIMQITSAGDLLEPLTTEAKGLAAGRQMTFTNQLSDGDTQLSVNILRLQGALRSVIDNAFKFTKQGKVTMTAGRVGDKFVITFTDTGIGIRRDEMPKLFTKFHRGTDALEFSYEGEGIGLYLTKLIVEEHGGTVKVKSELGKGTEVKVSMPVAGSPGAPKPTAEAALAR